MIASPFPPETGTSPPVQLAGGHSGSPIPVYAAGERGGIVNHNARSLRTFPRACERGQVRKHSKQNVAQRFERLQPFHLRLGQGDDSRLVNASVHGDDRARGKPSCVTNQTSWVTR